MGDTIIFIACQAIAVLLVLLIVGLWWLLA